jgi:hypothetical protein
MNDELTHDVVVESAARRLAEKYGRPLDEVRSIVQEIVIEAHRQYRAAGAPYADTAAGLIRWIIEAKQALIAGVIGLGHMLTICG